MQVIFCNIPASTSLRDLVGFAQSGVRPLLPFMRKPQIISYEILDITDKARVSNEFHGLVTYATPVDADKAVKSLNGKKLAGKKIAVRHFVHRSPGDKRVNAKAQGFNRPENQRREGLVIEKRSEKEANKPKVSAYNQTRIYNGS
jgi:hypothetical protein